MLKQLIVSAAAVACLAQSQVLAAPIAASLGPPLTLDSFNFGTVGSQADPWLLGETFTAVAPGTVVITDVDGVPLGNQIVPFVSGNWFQKTVINNTGVAWTSFEIELQEILGTPSGQGDGLSFAQGLPLVFSSNVFTTVTSIDITRDYRNFSGGVVAAGGSVTFLFAVTDNSPQSPFYLLQTPNRSDQPAPIPEPTTLLLLGMGLATVVRRLGHRA